MISMQGRTAVIFGVANKRSIAWSIAQKLQQAGANIAITYQNERLAQEAAGLIEGLPGFAHMWSFSNDADETSLVTTFAFFTSPTAARRAAQSQAWKGFIEEIGRKGCEGIQMSLLFPPAVSSSARAGRASALVALASA